MERMTQWTAGPGIQILEAENSIGNWVVSAVGLGSGGRCPDCQSLSTSRHSRYVRRLQDLPVQGITVALPVKLSRWRCRNQGCERETFSPSRLHLIKVIIIHLMRRAVWTRSLGPRRPSRLDECIIEEAPQRGSFECLCIAGWCGLASDLFCGIQRRWA
jgi:transposase